MSLHQINKLRGDHPTGSSISPYQGLTTQEVELSRQRYGGNVLTPPQRDPWWKLFLEKFNDPVIRILVVAAIIAIAVGLVEGEYIEGLGIIIAIFLATTLGFFNEYKANQEFELLSQVYDQTEIKVIRDGAFTKIQRKFLVVGDLVYLEQGQEVPADGTILEDVSLYVDQSKLTGESKAVKKLSEASATKLPQSESIYPIFKLYRSTIVSQGHGLVKITEVGDRTEIGKLAHAIITIENGAETPLNQQLEKLSQLIGKVGLLVSSLTFFALLLRGFFLGEISFSLLKSPEAITTLINYFMVAVTIIVVAVPEGLVMSVTLSLAYSMRKMAADNNLVRKMHACETIGAATVICTDKTGTLTQNQMRVGATHFPCLETQEPIALELGYNLIAESIAANSTADLELKNEASPQILGNVTEGALLLWLNSQNLDYIAYRNEFKLKLQMAFSTEKKYMASLGHSGVIEGNVLYVKGAPEVVLSHCSHILTEKGLKIFKDKQKFQETLENCQSQGMRTLAIAYHTLPSHLENIEPEAIDLIDHNLIWLGFVSIIDPLRTEVPQAISTCLKSGIQVKIVTGDSPQTAQEIAHQIGLWDDEIDLKTEAITHLTGQEFNQLSDAEAKEIVNTLKVMSRACPLDKLRLVKLLQENGAVVAVTGDGTNDAAALKQAQVGLAMGSGTAIAKEASDIILLNDSFSSIVNGIVWGRSLYQNIQRFILFQLTINVAALGIAFFGPFIGVSLPLTVPQMLWVNLIMDTFAALALATEPPHWSVIEEPPRNPEAFIISPLMTRNILAVGLSFLIFLVGFLIYLEQDGISEYELSVFFAVFVFLQFWNLFNARCLGLKQSAFSGLFRNKSLLMIATTILIGQVMIIQWGGAIFRTVPLAWQDWLTITLGTSLVLVIGEIVRFIKRRK
jgi:Ca2+-transporting ATPase